ncbi:HD domain-containing protein [Acidicapsa acidisoli]|uniref:HD domain-containing protein n=1 Tax=Acidicapsa acidisoli TaxID=1615681 RepID=UPI0021E03418|nr:HD domain-containing protein [Acidicapsa acidisoli]
MDINLVQLDTPEAVVAWMTRHGGEAYFGEPVTVLEHCLQAAFFARNKEKADSLVAAALLHDVGHLLHQGGEDVADHGIDTRHEELADQMLAAHLPPSVTEPIRLHVAAKRYLCFAEPAYRDALSPSSALSLGLQGGPMSEEEAKGFLALPFALDAVALRHWDDEAKIAGLHVPEIESYLPLLKTLWR